MKHILVAAALAASACAFAQPPERANQPVFRSGPWFVVRSVRDGGNIVACTGFYRANRHVQLSKDMLILQVPVEIRTVAFGYDDQPMGAPRPQSAGEKDLKGIAFAGDDFAKLRTSRKVRIEIANAQGTMRHELDLNGLVGALENIDQGCPVPADKPPARRRRH